MALSGSHILSVTVVALVLLFAVLRSDRKWLWLVLMCLVVPGVWLLLEWADFTHRWLETLLGFAAGAAGTGVWWAVWGRRLPPPSSDNIKVWGQDAAPRPKPAEMQAEIGRLREEKERLEAELRRLKGNDTDQGSGNP